MRLANGMHIGKLPRRIDPRTLQYGKYRLPVPPNQVGHENLIAANAWGMDGNGPDDTVAPGFQGAGNCVFAGGDHETLLWTTEGGTPAVFNGKTAIEDYSAVTGYVIGDPSTDVGTDVLTALNYRRNTGLVDINGARHKIGAYVALDVTKINAGDFSEFNEALDLFSVVALGINFPASAMTQFDAGQPWDVVSDDGGIEGGHYIPAVEKYADGTSDCITWAKPQKVTAAFWSKYVVEAYAILSPEMLKGGKSLEGYDLSTLQADLAEIDNSNPTITSVSIAPATSSIAAGATVQLAATDNNGNALAAVNWESLNQDICTISATGLVTGVAAGTATIYAIDTAANNLRGSATVTVTAPDPSKQIILRVGSETIEVFGVAQTMDVAPVLMDIGGGGRVMVPVRFVSQALGCTDEWEEATKTIVITPAVTTAELDAVKADLAAEKTAHANTLTKLADSESKLMKVKLDLGF